MSADERDPVLATARRRSLRRLAGRAGLAAILALAAVWTGGLLVFQERIVRDQMPREQADGIVVLTGGAERLNAGLGLLDDGFGSRLLISGVYERTDADDLRRTTIGSRALFECCVDLGKAALNTRGNAIETSEWAELHGYRRLIIVTANYHMPRSLLEFRCAMPSVELVPYPVMPPDVSLEGWWRRPGTTRLLAGEYTKYVFALLRAGTWRPALGLSGGCGT